VAIFLILSTDLKLFSQSDPSHIWTSSINTLSSDGLGQNGNAKDWHFDIIKIPNGEGYLTCGWATTGITGSYHNMSLLRIDANGRPVWPDVAKIYTDENIFFDIGGPSTTGASEFKRLIPYDENQAITVGPQNMAQPGNVPDYSPYINPQVAITRRYGTFARVDMLSGNVQSNTGKVRLIPNDIEVNNLSELSPYWVDFRIKGICNVPNSPDEFGIVMQMTDLVPEDPADITNTNYLAHNYGALGIINENGELSAFKKFEYSPDIESRLFSVTATINTSGGIDLYIAGEKEDSEGRRAAWMIKQPYDYTSDFSLAHTEVGYYPYSDNYLLSFNTGPDFTQHPCTSGADDSDYFNRAVDVMTDHNGDVVFTMKANMLDLDHFCNFQAGVGQTPNVGDPGEAEYFRDADVFLVKFNNDGVLQYAPKHIGHYSGEDFSAEITNSIDNKYLIQGTNGTPPYFQQPADADQFIENAIYLIKVGPDEYDSPDYKYFTPSDRDGCAFGVTALDDGTILLVGNDDVQFDNYNTVKLCDNLNTIAETSLTPFTGISTYSGEDFLQSDIIVQNGAELTIVERNLYFDPAYDAKIIVEPGGTLIISDSHLKGACDQMWQGIEVQANDDGSLLGLVKIENNSVIEDAHCGVCTGNMIVDVRPPIASSNEYFAGTIESTNTTYLNNRISIRMVINTPQSDNNSIFQNNTFLNTSNMKDVSRYGHQGMARFMEFRGPFAESIIIDEGNTFTGNERYNIHKRGVGIFIDQSPVDVNPNEVSASVIFRNLRNGISAFYTSDMIELNVSSVDMMNVAKGVYIQGGSDHNIVNSNFLDIPEAYCYAPPIMEADESGGPAPGGPVIWPPIEGRYADILLLEPISPYSFSCVANNTYGVYTHGASALLIQNNLFSNDASTSNACL